MINTTTRLPPNRESKKRCWKEASYTPRGVETALWDQVEPFVSESLSLLESQGIAITRELQRCVARISLWAAESGLRLNRELVFDPDSVERYVTQTFPEGRSRSTYRSQLRRLGPLLTSRAPWEPRPARMSRRQIAEPYSKDELECLIANARAQSTRRKEVAARTLIALGAGAGLDGRWVTQVQPSDLVEDDGCLLIQVGEPASRLVPVLERYENELRELAAGSTEKYLIGGDRVSRNRLSQLTASFVIPPGHPKLSASRLRSTWLVGHLNNGVRLPDLAYVAGIQTVTILSDLLPYLERSAESEYRAMMRGVV